MQRIILLLMLAGFAQHLCYGQQPPGAFTIKLSNDSPFYSGNALACRLNLSLGNDTTMNSIIFQNGIIDTAYRYSVVKLKTQPETDLDLGAAGSPGVFFLEIDTVSNLVTPNRPEHVFAVYTAFVHPANDDSCACNNTLNKYPLAAQRPLSFTRHEWPLLDSLVNRSNPDTISNRIDVLMSKQYQNAGCDTITQPPSWQMAFVLTNSPDSENNQNAVAIVLDTMGTGARDTARMIDACFNRFEYYLLNPADTAVDTTAISRDTKAKLLDSLKKIRVDTSRKFDVYYSNGFVRQVFALNRKMDIRYVCEKYCLYRRRDIVNQLVFVMKMPVPPH